MPSFIVAGCVTDFREGDHPDKLCDHKHCDHGDMFLIYHPNYGELMFNKLREYMGGCTSQ